MNSNINLNPTGLKNDLISERSLETSITKDLKTSQTTKIQSAVDERKWYAIYTRSRFEKKIFNLLQKAHFESFLPLVKEKRVWSDRIKKVQVPLLPSYVFVKTCKDQFPQIYLFPGFVRFVSFEGKPCTIRQEEICLLEQIVTHGTQIQHEAYCDVGDWVRIVRGPFKGWEGRVGKKKGKSRIVFQFECIRQAFSVEVCIGDVVVV